jgi:diaminopimelate decarboxylase
MKDLGLGIETASLGELEIALHAGFDPKVRITFGVQHHGFPHFVW